ncbi:hypothetical protein ElyMa_001816800 [Elysia marginata]|uniref:Uncharacterized protein n=1 Tax=Elysia marginata TaxID=1093978 RepID=A0AAV4EIB2_9GAST|nr:hypothetical protein ElyMa_001816800 [Elysia marginata]
MRRHFIFLSLSPSITSLEPLGLLHRKTLFSKEPEDIGKRAFSFIGPKLWNDLSLTTKENASPNRFKTNVKAHIFRTVSHLSHLSASPDAVLAAAIDDLTFCCHPALS